MERTGMHLITVAGNAERYVPPDLAGWTLRVGVVEANERLAYVECARIANELLKRLEPIVGDEGQLSTGYVRVAPRWNPERSRHTGYDASATLTVKVEVGRAGQVAAEAIRLGVGKIDGPYFEVARPEPIRRDLLAEAVGSARSKAEVVARAAERRLGRIVSVRERGVEGTGGGGGLMLSEAVYDMDVEMEVRASDLLVTAEVVVDFDLAD